MSPGLERGRAGVPDQDPETTATIKRVADTRQVFQLAPVKAPARGRRQRHGLDASGPGAPGLPGGHGLDAGHYDHQVGPSALPLPCPSHTPHHTPPPQTTPSRAAGWPACGSAAACGLLRRARG